MNWSLQTGELLTSDSRKQSMKAPANVGAFAGWYPEKNYKFRPRIRITSGCGAFYFTS